MNYMAAIMSQNGRKIAKMLHNVAKKFDWVVAIHTIKNFWITKYLISKRKFVNEVLSIGRL